MTEERDLEQLKSRLERLLEDGRRLDVDTAGEEPLYTELVHLTPKVHGGEPKPREEDEPIGRTLDEVLREFAEALERKQDPQL